MTLPQAYALRYAYRTESTKGEHFSGHIDDCHEGWPIHYYTWLVLDGDRVIMVDAGFTRQEAERRGARIYLRSPVELLGDLGIEPERVTDLVLTHLHYDHTGHLADFPNARIWVQRPELDFWYGPLAVRGASGHLRPEADLAALAALQDAGRVTVLEGDATVSPHVTVHAVGGHTYGMQIVRVKTPEGAIVLASDASHFYANLENDHPYAIGHDIPAMHAAFDRMAELTGVHGVIVPGHDPLVIDRHDPILETDDRIIRLRPSAHRPAQREDLP